MTPAIQMQSSGSITKENATAPRDINEKVSNGQFDNHTTELDLGNALLLMAPEIAEWIEVAAQGLHDALSMHTRIGGKPSRALLHQLHDLRGQTGSIGFPLASRVAAALLKLLEANKPAQVEVLTAHVDAIKAIILENARGIGNSLAKALVEALEEYGNIWTLPVAGNNSESSLGP
jgi:Hpt domain